KHWERSRPCFLSYARGARGGRKVQSPMSKVQRENRADCNLWTLDLGLWPLDLGLWTLDLGLWTLDYPLNPVAAAVVARAAFCKSTFPTAAAARASDRPTAGK